jgi:hypothetical protein
LWRAFQLLQRSTSEKQTWNRQLEALDSMEVTAQPVKKRLTTIWEEKRVIAICFIIGFAQFQYG